jgi:hypothetical protein
MITFVRPCFDILDLPSTPEPAPRPVDTSTSSDSASLHSARQSFSSESIHSAESDESTNSEGSATTTSSRRRRLARTGESGASPQPASAAAPIDLFTPNSIVTAGDSRRLMAHGSARNLGRLSPPVFRNVLTHSSAADHEQAPLALVAGQGFTAQPYSKVCKILNGANSILLSGENAKWMNSPVALMMSPERPQLNFDCLTPTQTSDCLASLHQLQPALFAEVTRELYAHSLKVKFDSGKRFRKTFVQQMSALAYICLKIGKVPEDKVFEYFAVAYPLHIASSLLVRAGDLFTLPRIACILRPLILECTNPEFTHQKRVAARTGSADVTSGLIAAYLEHHVGKRFDAKAGLGNFNRSVIEARADVLKSTPHIGKESRELLALAGAATNGISTDLNDLVNLVFNQASLPLTRQTSTELMGYFFSGGLRYARFAYDKSVTRRNHTATALGFGFTMIGFVPLVTQFTTLVAMVSDVSLKHYWNPKNAAGFIEDLANSFFENVSAALTDQNPSAADAFRIHFQSTYNAARNKPIEHPKVSLLRRGLGLSKRI